jgi:hypothetical protein
MPEIKNIFSNVDISKKPTVLKDNVIIPTQTLNGLTYKKLLRKGLKN